MLRKLLLLSPSYNFHDLLFLAPIFYNSGAHHVTKAAPYELQFGRIPLNSGPLGGNVAQPPKLFSDTVKEELKQLRKAMADRVKTTVELLNKAQEAYLKSTNKKRVATPEFKQGEICFIKDQGRSTYTGERAKFHPNLLKSPFLIVSSKPRSVVVMRLADSYITTRYPSDIVRFDEKKKSHEMFKDLSPEVLAIIGKPITAEKLMAISKQDPLDLLYVDRIVEPHTRPSTRSLTKKRDELENAFFSSPDFLDVDSEDDDEAPAKKVTFDLPGMSI